MNRAAAAVEFRLAAAEQLRAAAEGTMVGMTLRRGYRRPVKDNDELSDIGAELDRLIAGGIE